MASTLPRRIAVAAIAIPTVLLLVYLGGWPLVVAIQVLGVLGALEVYRLAAACGVQAMRGPGLLGAAAAPVVLFALAGGIPEPRPAWFGFAAIGWLLAVMAEAVRRGDPAARPLSGIAVTVFGALYAGALPAFLLLLRHGGTADRWGATWLVFLPLAVTWICDSMAMAGGAVIGGPKFAPVISPNKTWAGTLTGSASAAIVAPVYGIVLLAPAGISIASWKLAVLGIGLSIMAHVGDLAESLLKREAGVKDSGTFFPGHGGVLDRLDSLYWVLPAAAALLTLYGAV